LAVSLVTFRSRRRFGISFVIFVCCQFVTTSTSTTGSTGNLQFRYSTRKFPKMYPELGICKKFRIIERNKTFIYTLKFRVVLNTRTLRCLAKYLFTHTALFLVVQYAIRRYGVQLYHQTAYCSYHNKVKSNDTAIRATRF
jgi:hypothetical protein